MTLKKIKLGLIPSPNLPAKLTGKLFDDLPHFLSSHVDDSVSWELKIVIEPLVGSAEYMNQLMNKAIKLKTKNNWNYVICLTDLPHFMEKHVVIADINTQNHVALVSIPALGTFFVKHRVKQLLAEIFNDFYGVKAQNKTSISRQAYKKQIKKSWSYPMKRINLHDESEKPAKLQSKEKKDQRNAIAKDGARNEYIDQNKKNSNDEEFKGKAEDEKDEQTQEETDKKSDIRYIITSKLLGRLQILAGMTLANRPWTALISFKKILMLAFGTGIYITIFPTPWELSIVYSIPRFISLMFVTIIGMVTWIIFTHRLWERPSQKGDVRLRKLYNYTTITTLSVIVFINYIVLYFLLLAAIGIFIPFGFLEEGTNLEVNPTIRHYFQLAWIVTSLGTLAGSIGTASENEEKIRQSTYSYRQINRYYEIEDDHNKAEDNDDK